MEFVEEFGANVDRFKELNEYKPVNIFFELGTKIILRP